jgi:hypothetical protein
MTHEEESERIQSMKLHIVCAFQHRRNPSGHTLSSLTVNFDGSTPTVVRTVKIASRASAGISRLHNPFTHAFFTRSATSRNVVSS